MANNIQMNLRKMDSMLQNGLFNELDDYVNRALACKDKVSKDEKFLAWICKLNIKTINETGNSGLLQNAGCIENAINIFKSLKQLIQRVEWWPEFDMNEFYDFVVNNHISSYEILESVRAFTIHQKYVTERIKGGKAIDFFAMEQQEIDSFVKDAGNWLKGRNKISVITCCNDKDEFNEMKRWIERLYYPSELLIEVNSVEGAKSICSGYNEGMMSTDAALKMYMHQDVRIINPFFIFEVISLFHRHKELGMIGMIGAQGIPRTGVMWDVERVGAVFETMFGDDFVEKTIVEENRNEMEHEVSLIDGFMMVTSSDLKWNEEKITGWDFYDTSHSIDYLLSGYKIIVPRQKIPWCLHDFGQMDLSKYEDNRKEFLSAYYDLFNATQ